MITYDKFSYIYPPRPKNAVPLDDLDFWDNGMLIAQPKLNGSNAVVFLNGETVQVYSRHADRLSNVKMEESELLKLHSGQGWMVLNGEYMNKSKKDENEEVFNHKFVIFDILVHNGQYLVGTSFSERIQILDDIFGRKDSDKSYLWGISENVYRVKSFTTNFKQAFSELTKIDMIEGLVCKRKSAKLELGTSEENNTKTQLKFRKPTKNYRY